MKFIIANSFFNPHTTNILMSFNNSYVCYNVLEQGSTETVGKTDINTCIVSELNNQNINV